jgi:hypothetical protein
MSSQIGGNNNDNDQLGPKTVMIAVLSLLP